MVRAFVMTGSATLTAPRLATLKTFSVKLTCSTEPVRSRLRIGRFFLWSLFADQAIRSNSRHRLLRYDRRIHRLGLRVQRRGARTGTASLWEVDVHPGGCQNHPQFVLLVLVCKFL